MASQKFEYFFDLPPELREQILCHLCLFPTGILVGGGKHGLTIAVPSASPLAVTPPHASHPPPPVSDQQEVPEEHEYAGPPLDLFLASPVLYREAGDIYYGRNVFHVEFAHLSPLAWGFDKQWMSYPRMRDQMGLFSEIRTVGARRRIRSVVLHVRRFGGIISDVAVPALGDMVLNGALRRLRVDVREGWGGIQMVRVRNMDHTANPDLRGLLAVLTDPDMERAELRVWKWLHARFWCQFHRGLVPWARACVLPVDNVGFREGCLLSANKVEFLDVSIPRVVEVCGGNAAEFHIKRVRVG